MENTREIKPCPQISFDDGTGVLDCHLVPRMSFPGGSDGKESACSVGDLSSILGSGRSPGEENGNPLQDSCLESSTDRGAWRATDHGAGGGRRRGRHD